jgi:hypothetical protein
MKIVAAFILKEALSDVRTGCFRSYPRTNIGALLYFIFLWATLPIWGPVRLAYLGLDNLGERLR